MLAPPSARGKPDAKPEENVFSFPGMPNTAKNKKGEKSDFAV